MQRHTRESWPAMAMGIRFTVPTVRWACRAVAKLGGFADTKRIGRPGWDAFWHGWARLQQCIQGYRLAQQMDAQM